jgi:hypothetical protein
MILDIAPLMLVTLLAVPTPVAAVSATSAAEA